MAWHSSRFENLLSLLDFFFSLSDWISFPNRIRLHPFTVESIEALARDRVVWKTLSCFLHLYWKWAWDEFVHLAGHDWLQTQAVCSSAPSHWSLFVFTCHHQVHFHISSIVNRFSMTVSFLEHVFLSRLPNSKFSLMTYNISNLEFYLNVNIGSEGSVNYTEKFKLLFKMAPHSFITKIICVLCVLSKWLKTYIKTVWIYAYTYNLF